MITPVVKCVWLNSVTTHANKQLSIWRQRAITLYELSERAAALANLLYELACSGKDERSWLPSDDSLYQVSLK